MIKKTHNIFKEYNRVIKILYYRSGSFVNCVHKIRYANLLLYKIQGDKYSVIKGAERMSNRLNSLILRDE